MKYLRQSTATTIVVGPFVDPTAALPVVSLADQTANGRIAKNGTGATITSVGALTSWAHDGQGQYLIGLATAHADTIGRLRIYFYLAATYLPTWEDFSVLNAAVYDSIFGTVALSTYAGADTTGTTTLLTRLTAGRATALDNLDAAISTRSTYAGADTTGTTALLSRLTSGRAVALDNLDAAISTRSTYAGGPVASVASPVTVVATQLPIFTGGLVVAGATNASVTLAGVFPTDLVDGCFVGLALRIDGLDGKVPSETRTVATSIVSAAGTRLTLTFVAPNLFSRAPGQTGTVYGILVGRQ